MINVLRELINIGTFKMKEFSYADEKKKKKKKKMKKKKKKFASRIGKFRLKKKTGTNGLIFLIVQTSPMYLKFCFLK